MRTGSHGSAGRLERRRLGVDAGTDGGSRGGDGTVRRRPGRQPQRREEAAGPHGARSPRPRSDAGRHSGDRRGPRSRTRGGGAGPTATALARARRRPRARRQVRAAAGRSPNAVAQVPVNVVDHLMGLQAAVNLPRIHWSGDELEMTRRISPVAVCCSSASAGSRVRVRRRSAVAFCCSKAAV